MQKYLILFFCLSIFPIAYAQEALDTSGQSDCEHLDDLIWVKDSLYKAFVSNKFGSLKVFYPSYRTYRGYIDSSYAGTQSEITKYYMYNQFWNSLRFQYLKLAKRTNKAGIDWSKTTLDSFYIDSGSSGGRDFAHVNIIIKYNNKRKYHYGALFLYMDGKWYLMDELKMFGLVVEKKKRKKRK